MKKDDAFVRRLVEYLECDGQDINSLANLIGVEKLTIKSWLSGEKAPHSSIISPIEKIIAESISSFFNK